MKLLLLCLLLVLQVPAQQGTIGRAEVRNNRLFITVDGQERLISVDAIASWPGWLPNVVIYTDRAGGRELLRWYDVTTRKSFDISHEDLHVVDVSTVRLSNGSYAILLGLRDPKTNMPSAAIATVDGIFHRERNAVYGTAANDVVEMRRFDEEQLLRTKGDVTYLKPAAVVNVPLTRPETSAAGLYEAVVPVGDGSTRTVTLNLRAGGSATMIATVPGGDPVVRRGKWTQKGVEIRCDLEGSPIESFVWAHTADGLAPRTWDRAVWGAAGLSFRRAEANVSAPRRAPGTTR